jgi:hypothetical protein
MKILQQCNVATYDKIFPIPPADSLQSACMAKGALAIFSDPCSTPFFPGILQFIAPEF